MSENKWLSLFFWQEYEIKIKPDCLKSDNFNGIINQSEMNIISDRLSGSFYSVNTSSLSKNDPTFEYNEFRLMVKRYISIFKEHIFDLDHPINKISKAFIKYYSMYVDEELKEIQGVRKSITKSFRAIVEHRINNIIKHLQGFIIKLKVALRLMYARTINYSCFVEENDEFVNLITNLIFREDLLYKKISEAYGVLLSDKINQLEINFENLQDIKPEDLNLNEKFCLNETTKKYQRKILEEYYRKKLEKKVNERNG